MRSFKRLALASRSILISTLLCVGTSACVTAPAVFLNASPCSDLIPDEWNLGVDSAPLPAGPTVGGWMAFGDAQTGQLDKANRNTKDAISIVKKCEARDKAVVAAMQPKPWWHLW